MDYEKEYKRALERARIWKYKSGMPKDRQGILDDIFPNLKDSEGERIRNGIICGMNALKEQKKVTFADIPIDEVITWLEKQDEQKPADKVEPKFKVGDWVVQGRNILKIRCVGAEYYCFETVGGYVDDMLVSEIDSLYHLWTIQDANDGDVLACPRKNGMENGEQIFIFKGINNRDYVDNCIEYYCRVCDGEFYVNTTGYMGTTSSPLYPATNEQRGTLMKAMADAGWKFDFEKKELKKIEQKLTWSEEDEDLMKWSVDNLTELKNRFGAEYGKVGKCIYWLKSLKDRYT